MNRTDRRRRQREAPEQVQQLAEMLEQQAQAQSEALVAAHRIIELQRQAIMRVRELCDQRVEQLTGRKFLKGSGATVFVTDVINALDGDQ